MYQVSAARPGEDAATGPATRDSQPLEAEPLEAFAAPATALETAVIVWTSAAIVGCLVTPFLLC